MRVPVVPFLTFICMTASGQELPGKYQDYFGHSLQLNKDSTFRLDWRFDLIHTWGTGTWTSSGRLICLRFINVYDTLSRTGKPDSLVLSLDEISNRINEGEFAMTLIVSGGQRNDGFSDKLFQKGKRLFLIHKNGKLDRTRRRGIWPQKKWPWGYKKWPTWYRKKN